MKDQKIGIVTWFNYPNPGTAFQAYALQKFINSIPHCKAEIVNMLNSNPIFTIKANLIRRRNKYPIILLYISIIIHWIKAYLYCSFQRKNFVIWPTKELKRDEYSRVNDRYDWMILGSDQLWNLHISPNSKFDKALFLDFVNGKHKGAYGPSTGDDVWPEEIRGQIEELLSDFSFIGVREKQAVSMVQSLAKVPVHWSLDPTFLLDKRDWAKIAKKLPIKEDYIFEYCINKSSLLREITEKLSMVTGLPIIESHGDIRKHVPSAKRMPHPSADTWLGYLMNAKYVVTDSFHGCAFCVNTNRDFFAIVTSNGSRIHSMLELFDLQSRVFTDPSEIDPSKSIDWDSVNQKLEERRKESQGWLKSSLMESE